MTGTTLRSYSFGYIGIKGILLQIALTLLALTGYFFIASLVIALFSALFLPSGPPLALPAVSVVFLVFWCLAGLNLLVTYGFGRYLLLRRAIYTKKERENED